MLHRKLGYLFFFFYAKNNSIPFDVRVKPTFSYNGLPSGDALSQRRLTPLVCAKEIISWSREAAIPLPRHCGTHGMRNEITASEWHEYKRIKEGKILAKTGKDMSP